MTMGVKSQDWIESILEKTSLLAAMIVKILKYKEDKFGLPMQLRRLLLAQKKKKGHMRHYNRWRIIMREEDKIITQ